MLHRSKGALLLPFYCAAVIFISLICFWHTMDLSFWHAMDLG